VHVNLLALYNLYLIVIFALGTAARYRVYGQVVSLVLALPQRWPKLSQLVLEHRWLFLNWRTLLPSVLTLVLTAVNSAVYYLLLPQATLTPRDLSGHFFLAGLLSVLAAVVVLLDGYALSIRGDIRTPELDKQLDQAEFWLSSRWANVVEWFTLRRVRPRQMVAEHLRNALEAVAETINWAMWYWAAQLLARGLLAVALWFTWYWLTQR
jgi:hypothetical protein